MIRSFIYLDSQKLRSISSQVFEGLTDRVLRTHRENMSESEEQKGDLGSGRVLGDIFSREESSTELRFLEDHAYSLLELELKNRELVDVFDSASNNVKFASSFILVSSKLHISDFTAMKKMFLEFNEIGEALWRMTNMSNAPAGGLASKNISDSEVRKNAERDGLQLNKKFIESASRLTEFGFEDLLEASVVINNHRFIAPLKREFLRDSEAHLLHKYSRLTQYNFSILGLVTQQGGSTQELQSISDVKNADGVKAAMRTLSQHLNTVEQFFAAPVKNETVIDPIAIYRVL